MQISIINWLVCMTIDSNKNEPIKAIPPYFKKDGKALKEFYV